jgi:hypothetical protein
MSGAAEWVAQYFDAFTSTGRLWICKICGALIDHGHRLTHARFHGKHPDPPGPGPRLRGMPPGRPR